jgi:hypothetical protein
MPWSPSYDDAEPDPRLDRYRGRAAHLMDGEVLAGHVLVESDYRAEVTGGALWWRRWSRPFEFATVFAKIGTGEATVAALDPSDADLFDRWAEHGYEVGRRVLQVVWLDEAESERVHDEVFGHEH